MEIDLEDEIISYVNENPPRVEIDRAVPHPNKDYGIIGFVGRDINRDKMVFVSEKKRSNIYRTHGGWAISENVLTVLRGYGCRSIYFLDTKTDDVLEYLLLQYQHGYEIIHRENDPQRCVPIDNNVNGWKGYGQRLFTWEFKDMEDEYKQPDVLKKMYWDENMSTKEIGEELGVSKGTIGYWMDKHGIPTRTIEQARVVNE